MRLLNGNCQDLTPSVPVTPSVPTPVPPPVPTPSVPATVPPTVPTQTVPLRRFTPHLLANLLICCLFVGLGGCERAKTRLDREVDRLCAVDGGMRVFETVHLPKELFGPPPYEHVFHEYRMRRIDEGRLGLSYIHKEESKILVQGSPALGRYRSLILRVRDQKVLAEFVVYKRSGGDFPGPWEPSVKTCGQEEQSKNFYHQVFIKGK